MAFSNSFAAQHMGFGHEFGENSVESVHQHQYQQHYSTGSSTNLSEQHKNLYAPGGVPQPICDTKPRLTKEQHDILEAHYTNQPKPNTSTKKGFAESLGVSLDKVNVSRFVLSRVR